MDNRILELKAHLAELDQFLAGRVFRGWEAARLARLREVEADILDRPASELKDVLEQYQLRGERRLLLDLANQFESVRDTLNEQLAELEAGSENLDAATSNQTDNHEVQ